MIIITNANTDGVKKSELTSLFCFMGAVPCVWDPPARSALIAVEREESGAVVCGTSTDHNSTGRVSIRSPASQPAPDRGFTTYYLDRLPKAFFMSVTNRATLFGFWANKSKIGPNTF